MSMLFNKEKTKNRLKVPTNIDQVCDAIKRQQQTQTEFVTKNNHAKNSMKILLRGRTTIII